MTSNKITIFLWVDSKAEEAAKHYTSIFPNSHIKRTSYYQGESAKQHGQEPGSVMTVEFVLDGRSMVAMNGTTAKFTPAISFQVGCEDQEEVDHYWEKLCEGGDESKQRCGWLEDKFGVSWQVVPKEMVQIFKEGNPEKAGRVMQKMRTMKKLDMTVLKAAYDGDDDA